MTFHYAQTKLVMMLSYRCMKSVGRFLRLRKITILLIFTLSVILLGNAFVVMKILARDPLDAEVPVIQDAVLRMNNIQLDEFFAKVAHDEGAVFAYNVLRKIQLPQGVDAHVVGHTIGEILYKQQGVEGIRYCTDEFNNACSHAVVIGHFTNKGEGVIKEIAEECKQVPGGKQGYTMCFHGLGHGVFAFFDYNFEKTIPMCRKAGERDNGVEFTECVGGAVMESISGGLHNKDIWDKNTRKYFTTEDQLYPCNSEIFPDDAKPICYVYLTPHLFREAGFGIGVVPKDEQLTRAFSFCEKIKVDYIRTSCFEGFGKELVTMANDWNSDIEGKNGFDSQKIAKLSRWCHLGSSPEAKSACITSSVSVLYWGGIKDPKFANEFCGLQQGADQELCFRHFVGQINYYAQNKQQTCRGISSEWRDRCLGKE